MMGLVGLFAYGVWLLWLLHRDAKERPSVSSGVWIVLAWAVIHGSRPLTSWVAGVDQGLALPESRDEGNPGEALVNLFLIGAGLIVLVRRGVRLPAVIRDNKWLFVFYLFWLMGVVWSEYPIITFKRLFKDIGTIVMMLVVLTDREPGESVRAVCARLAYIGIPLSILLYRYFPDWGRVYAGYDQSQQMFVGVTTHKNTLGVLVLVSALFLQWDLRELRGKSRSVTEKVAFAFRALVLLMCWYLLLTINSVTSLVCAVGGSVLLITFSLPFVRRSPARVEAFGLGTAVVLWLFEGLSSIKEAFVTSLGRDVTLTNRTDIWAVVIDYQDSPLVGAGFDTFWAGRRLVLLAENTYGIIQAHSGYLETYLNGGLIGVGLLVILLFSAYWRIRKKLVLGKLEDSTRLAILLVALIYNISEASFNKPGIMWFVTLFAIMEYRAQPRPRLAVPDGRQ